MVWQTVLARSADCLAAIYVHGDLRIRCEALAAWSVVDFAPLACAARARECLRLASARGWPDCPRRMQWAGPGVHQLRDALYSRNTHSREYSATTCRASAPHQYSVSRGRGRNGSSMHPTTPSDGQACAGASALLQGRLGGPHALHAGLRGNAPATHQPQPASHYPHRIRDWSLVSTFVVTVFVCVIGDPMNPAADIGP